jgi:hypothetical protein
MFGGPAEISPAALYPVSKQNLYTHYVRRLGLWFLAASHGGRIPNLGPVQARLNVAQAELHRGHLWACGYR